MPSSTLVAWIALSSVLAIVRRLMDLPSAQRTTTTAAGRLVLRLSSGRWRSFLQLSIGAILLLGCVLPWPEAADLDAPLARDALSFAIATLSGEALARIFCLWFVGDDVRNAARIEMRSAGRIAQRVPAIILVGSLVLCAALRLNHLLDAAALPGILRAYLRLCWFALLLTLWSPRTELAVEGMYIWGARSRFVPLTAFDAFVPRWWGLELRRGRQTLQRLWFLRTVDGPTREDVTQRLRAMDDLRRTRDAAVASAIARGTGVDANGHAYRVNAMPRDDLWRIVEAASAPAAVRVAAARELTTHLQQDDEARFDAIAETATDPEIRRALSVRRS